MLKVGIVGGTGYTGQELVRMLYSHPEVKIEGILTRSYAEEKFADIYSNLKGFTDIICEEFEDRSIINRSDVIITALPHSLSAPIVMEAYHKGKKVVDLGADFRFSNVEVYKSWYKVKHPCPELLKEAVYAIPEINRDEIKNAIIVGNPGCYPTCSILSIAPLLTEDFIDEHSIIIDAKTGVSGAGRSLKLGSHFCECNESIKAYGVAGHRHLPEIEEQLTKISGKNVTASFTPHLVPMNRGILTTIYASLKKDVSLEELYQVYREFYRNEYFVRIMEKDKMPETRQVRNSNFCDIGIAVDEHAGKVIVCGVIDNLVKGASGQAIQNMNIICGLPEIMGLDTPPVYL